MITAWFWGLNWFNGDWLIYILRERMKSVIVVVLLLGLAAAQYVQNEPAIQVVQVKAAITEVDDEVK